MKSIDKPNARLRPVHPLGDVLAEIDAAPVAGRKRNAARDKKQLPEIIRAHYRAAKRHYTPLAPS
jgi:hypothetical protein